MVEKTATLRLRFDTGGADRASRDLDKVGDEAKQAAREVDNLGDQSQRAGQQMDRGLGEGAGAAVRRLGVLGSAAATAAAAFASIGAIRISSNLESEFAKVETLLDDSSFAVGTLTGNIAGLKDGLVQLRADTGETFANLSQGLFDLVSAGVSAADAINVLESSTVLARAGVTDVAVSVDGLTTALNAYGESADRAEILASKFFTAQKFGKTTVEELSRGLGQVAPLAAQLGVSFDELLASQASATSAGIRQSEAYTGLKAALTNIIKPSQDAAAEAERLGVGFDAANLKAKGFTQFLAEIQKSANFTDESFQRLFGSAEALNFVLAVSGGGAEVYARTLRELGDETKSLATLQDAAATVSAKSGQALRELGGAIDQIAIAIGDAGALAGYTELIRQLTDALRSDAALNFAKGVGEALADATFAAAGLLSVLQDINNLIPGGGEGGFDPRKYVPNPFTGGLLGVALGENNVFDPGRAYNRLADRGRQEAASRERLTESQALDASVLAEAQKQLEQIFADSERLAEVWDFLAETGPQIAISDAGIKSVDQLTTSLRKASDEVVDLDAETKRVAGAIAATQASFAPQLEAARALRDAAAISDAEYEKTVRRLEIEGEITQEIERRKKAGEEFDEATLAALIRERESLLDTADALIEARDRLQQRTRQEFENRLDVISDVRFGPIDPREAEILQKGLDASFGGFFEDLDDAFAEGLIDDEEFRRLQEAATDLYGRSRAGIVEGATEAAAILRDQLSNSIGFLLDDLLFNGGGRIDDFFKGLTRDFANDNLIDPIARAISGDGGLVTNITEAFGKTTQNFQNAFASILGKGSFASGAGLLAQAGFAGFTGYKLGTNLADLLGITGNPSSTKAGGIIGGAAGLAGGLAAIGPGFALSAIGSGTLGGALAGSVVPIVGTIIGAVLGPIIAGLLSKPSNFTAQGVFNPGTGEIAGLGQDKNSGENAKFRDALIENITDVTTAVTDLIGGDVRDVVGTAANEAFLNIAVRSDRKTGKPFIELGFQGPAGEPVGGGKFEATEEGALEAITAAIRLTISAITGGEEALIAFAEAGLAAGEDIDAVLTGLATLSGIFKEIGDNAPALRQYVEASIAAGRSADEIAGGLTALKGVFDLTVEPLSAVEQALKQIDDVINPVIKDLESLGLSIADIANVANEAARAVGETFIGDVQDQILELQNSTLAQYKRVLAEIDQRQKDATTLLGRGAITQGEFESVQFLNALQAQKFFENLSPDDLEALGDFFGVLGDTAGDTVVKLAQLTQGIVDFADNVTETIAVLQAEADDIQGAVDRAFDVRTSILDRFSPLLPQDQITDIRGQLTQILAEIGQPGQSAEFVSDSINRASDLARQFVDLSAELFGPTARFGQNRDFATDILAQIGEAGQGQVDERLSIIDAANSQVAILNDIREAIAGPDASLDFLQSTLDENRVTNTILRDLLAAYITAANSQAQVINPGALQSASDAYFANGGAQPTANGSSAEITGALRAADLAAENRANRMQTSIDRLIELLSENNTQTQEATDLLRAAA